VQQDAKDEYVALSCPLAAMPTPSKLGIHCATGLVRTYPALPVSGLNRQAEKSEKLRVYHAHL